jgi:hypothetical protein
MKPLRFYEHFAVAYGTQWLLVMLLATCTGSRINTGLIGLIGFPIIALLYAFWRWFRSKETPPQQRTASDANLTEEPESA